MNLRTPSREASFTPPMWGVTTTFDGRRKGSSVRWGSSQRTSSPAPAIHSSSRARSRACRLHDAAPCNVDEEGISVHGPEKGFADDIFRLGGEGKGRHHEFRPLHRLFRIRERNEGVDSPAGVVCGESPVDPGHVHAEGLHAHRNGPPHVSEADDAGLLSPTGPFPEECRPSLREAFPGHGRIAWPESACGGTPLPRPLRHSPFRWTEHCRRRFPCGNRRRGRSPSAPAPHCWTSFRAGARESSSSSTVTGLTTSISASARASRPSSGSAMRISWPAKALSKDSFRRRNSFPQNTTFISVPPGRRPFLPSPFPGRRRRRGCGCFRCWRPGCCTR